MPWKVWDTYVSNDSVMQAWKCIVDTGCVTVLHSRYVSYRYNTMAELIQDAVISNLVDVDFSLSYNEKVMLDTDHNL